MNSKKQIIIQALVITLFAPAISGSIEIRQEPYTFRMAMAQDVTTDTFVISEKSHTMNQDVVTSRFSPVYFDLGSANLSPVAEERIVSDLESCRGTKRTPLFVTGHACQLGTEKSNQILSMQRAKTVTQFLWNHDVVVAGVQGKGTQQPVTQDFRELWKNRRVEITMQP